MGFIKCGHTPQAPICATTVQHLVATAPTTTTTTTKPLKKVTI
jgi:hypothetical protein